MKDGRTPFRWAPEQLIEFSNDIAVTGSRHYGTVVHPAVFDPPCNAYGRRPDGSTFLRAQSAEDSGPQPGPFMDLDFSPSPRPAPYPLSFYRAVVSQPIFADPNGACDSMTRFFDTAVTTGAGFAPVEVLGRVRSNLGPFIEEVEDLEVYGVQVATAFVENNYLECDAIHAYLGHDGGRQRAYL